MISWMSLSTITPPPLIAGGPFTAKPVMVVILLMKHYLHYWSVTLSLLPPNCRRPIHGQGWHQGRPCQIHPGIAGSCE